MKRALALLIAVAPWSLASALPHEGCFRAAARLHGVPADLLIAVAQVESNLNAGAMSAASAHGVMQIQWPVTARHLGVRKPAELYNPCRNIDLGARYLAELLARYGDERLALAAYNYGPTRIDAAGEVPAGALRYAERVERARARLAAPAFASANTVVVFDNPRRAERFALAVNRQLSQPAARMRETGSRTAVYVDPGVSLGASDRRVLLSAGLLEARRP